MLSSCMQPNGTTTTTKKKKDKQNPLQMDDWWQQLHDDLVRLRDNTFELFEAQPGTAGIFLNNVCDRTNDEIAALTPEDQIGAAQQCWALRLEPIHNFF